MGKGNSDSGILHVTLLSSLCKGRGVPSELGIKKELLSVRGLLEIVGTATANLCRSQDHQRQLVQLSICAGHGTSIKLAQPLPTFADHRTSTDSWYSHCQPPQIVGTVTVNQLRTELLIRLNHINMCFPPFHMAMATFPILEKLCCLWNSR